MRQLRRCCDSLWKLPNARTATNGTVLHKNLKEGTLWFIYCATLDKSVLVDSKPPTSAKKRP